MYGLEPRRPGWLPRKLLGFRKDHLGLEWLFDSRQQGYCSKLQSPFSQAFTNGQAYCIEVGNWCIDHRGCHRFRSLEAGYWQRGIQRLFHCSIEKDRRHLAFCLRSLIHIFVICLLPPNPACVVDSIPVWNNSMHNLSEVFASQSPSSPDRWHHCLANL